MASARLVAGLAAHWLRVHAQLGNRVAVLFASLTVDVLARGGRAGRPWSSPGTAESPADVTGRADQEPPHPRVAEELETPPHVRGGRVRVRERREIGADAAIGVEYGEDLPRVLHCRPDLRLVADHAGVVFRCRDLGRGHGGDPCRVEAVERLPDAVPLGVNVRQIPASKTARDRCARKNAGSSGAWSRNFWNGAVSGSAAAVS